VRLSVDLLAKVPFVKRCVVMVYWLEWKVATTATC